MLAKRWHLLTAFGGGCLSTVLLVVVWRADGGTPEPRERRDLRAPQHEVVEPTTPELSDATVEPAPIAATKPEAGAVSEPASESGRSLAEVLARLEAEYRERVAAARSADALATEEPSTDAPLPVAPAPAAIAVAPPVAVAPVAVAPLPVAPAAVAPPAAPPAVTPSEPGPVLAAVAMPPREARAEEADRAARDLYLANLYQMEAYQRQQLAILGYLELLSQTPANVPSSRRAPVPSTARRSPSFSFPLTNPDNPWGFNHPPPVLAK